jgi:hypothetical protein
LRFVHRRRSLKASPREGIFHPRQKPGRCSPRNCALVTLHAEGAQGHTALTYHRTWETGVEVITQVMVSAPNFFVHNPPFRPGCV